MRRLLAGMILAVAFVLFAALPASAHPLGNFTVNRYARVEVSAGLVRVYYVLDEAEIPAFQDRQALDADPSGFGRNRTADIIGHLRLAVDGGVVSLHDASHDLSQPMGQGGLHTLRLAAVLEAGVPGLVPGSHHKIEFVDGNEPDRVGWREIVVTARGDTSVVESSAPGKDSSDELRKYPADLIHAPLDLRSASFTFTAGTQTAPALPIVRTAAAPPRYGGQFASLVTRHGLTPWVLAGILVGAFLFGAAHALAPGHGKTVMAAYLVGTKGRPIDAVFLGVVVSAMHTASVLLLGLVLAEVNRSTPIDRLYPSLTVAGGLAVVAVGAWMLVSRLRHQRAHAHGHDHHHDHGPAPMSRKGLAVLATSGGILPSPSAVIVLVAAFTLGRVWLGLALVGAFSIGLAATLTAVGLALVVGRRAVERRWSGRGLAWLPVASAAALVVLGLVVAANGARSLTRHPHPARTVAAAPAAAPATPTTFRPYLSDSERNGRKVGTTAAGPAPVAGKCAARSPSTGTIPGEDARGGKRWVTVGELAGACDRQSAPFHLAGVDTRLVYRSDAASFTVFLVDAKKGTDATAGYADADCAGPCADSQVLVDQAGDYFLQVQAGDSPWQVLVQEYRR